MDTKRLAAEKAVEHVKDGMIVGLGTGSTSYWAIKAIGEKVKAGLDVKAVASSEKSEELAREAGIPLVEFSELPFIHIYIDGADEVDAQHNLIKGGGGALLREKILAYNSRQFLVIVDETKLVETLGKFPLPVEVVPFAVELTIKQLQRLDCETRIRQGEGGNFMTDNHNLIVDCQFAKVADPAELNKRLQLIPGVVDCGLFERKMVHSVIVGYKDGRTEVMNTSH